MEIVQAYATKNKCYQMAAPLTPRGIMLHSIGCPQPNAAVMARYYNQYQPGGQSVCVHGFIQRDGTYYQTLPYTMRAWHCGGSANSTHIGIEMTEPASIAYTGHGAEWRDLNPAATETHVRGTYAAAVQLFAQLCAQFDLDPLADGVIISHAEGRMRGVASPHADPTHLWNAFGLTMDMFRRDVYNAMHGIANNDNDVEDDNMVKYKTIDDVPEWYRSEVQELIDAGALKGTSNGVLDISEDVVRGAIIGMRYAEAKNPHYHSVDDMPEYYRKEAQELIDRGALRGVGGNDLNVSEDALRSMIACQRMIDSKEGKA